jgi:hypothetical protein
MYYKNGVQSVINEEVSGFIPFEAIEDICLHLDKNKGCRFDLVTRDASNPSGQTRIYELRALNPDVAIQWTQKIAAAADSTANDVDFLKTVKNVPRGLVLNIGDSKSDPSPTRNMSKVSKRASLITFQGTFASHTGLT